MRLGVRMSPALASSTVTAASSLVTRAAGRESVIGYGITPGSCISYCPYCTTSVPPARAKANSFGVAARSASLTWYARGPITMAEKRDRSVEAMAAGASSSVGMSRARSAEMPSSLTPAM